MNAREYRDGLGLKYVGAALSDRGRTRRRNEDAVLPPTDIGPHARGTTLLFACADGVGGLRSGDRASQCAIASLHRAFVAQLEADTADRLRLACRKAHQAVSRQNAGRTNHERMATTLVVGAIARDELWVANAGDSRAYLLRDGTALQITRDHSLFAEEIASGSRDSGHGEPLPYRNVVTRSLGISDDLDFDLFGPIRLHPEDRVLLCTDGLHNAVTDAEIAALGGVQKPLPATKMLVLLANARGGRDNISIVVVRATAAGAASPV